MIADRPYHAYGDESCGPDVVTYALAAFKREDLAELGDAITQVKMRFGGHADSALHCRELFSGHMRAKGSWKHLDLPEVIALYNATLDVILPSLHSAAVCYALKAEMPAEIGMFDDNDNLSPMPGMRADGTSALGEKEIASFCAIGCAIPLIATLSEPDVAIYAASEQSMIRKFGRREQFDRTVRGFVDRGGIPNRFQASTEAPTPALFEIADCFAYFPQKTIMISDNPAFVEASTRALRDRIPYKKARLAFPNGRMAVHVE